MSSEDLVKSNRSSTTNFETNKHKSTQWSHLLLLYRSIQRMQFGRQTSTPAPFSPLWLTRPRRLANVLQPSKRLLRDCKKCSQVQFAGLEKKTEIGLNPTAKDRTTGCGCTNSEFFSVASCDVCRKIEKPKKTGLDRLQPVFRPVTCWTLLTHIFP